ncbi:hypothetical protein T4B_112 [Trichinella pseudospiralis]|uniref:Uncharacterized protein n=1 Tax=Trichinella pseudospiralis TaxID=6337 RepID=A0A0V1EPS2_TRIPS|nr:hypothetical protein T4A_5604 [Trichinella pseudospiralis]KRZ24089.1 hypothetical protein T4B_112 [Trichinella pseudospiralis]
MDRHGLVNADRSEQLVQRGFGRANAHHSNLSVVEVVLCCLLHNLQTCYGMNLLLVAANLASDEPINQYARISFFWKVAKHLASSYLFCMQWCDDELILTFQKKFK